MSELTRPLVATTTVDLIVKTGAGRVSHVYLEGTTGATWSLYDGSDATGVLLGTFRCIGTEATHSFEWPVMFSAGLFLDKTGGTSSVSIIYE